VPVYGAFDVQLIVFVPTILPFHTIVPFFAFFAFITFQLLYKYIPVPGVTSSSNCTFTFETPDGISENVTFVPSLFKN